MIYSVSYILHWLKYKNLFGIRILIYFHDGTILSSIEEVAVAKLCLNNIRGKNTQTPTKSHLDITNLFNLMSNDQPRVSEM